MNMQSKLASCFTNSAAVLLAGVAAAFFAANLATGNLVQPHDPVLVVSTRSLSWVLTAAGLAASLLCIYSVNSRLKIALILWLSLDVLVYGFGFYWAGAHDIHSYLDIVAEPFALSSATATAILTVVFLYLLGGSCYLLTRDWLQKRDLEGSGYLKAPCPSCGAHIQFPAQNIGQKIACPHCQTMVTLRRPGDSMRMTCVLCGGHIEFPAHAVGQKLKCPHCKMNITLKEQT